MTQIWISWWNNCLCLTRQRKKEHIYRNQVPQVILVWATRRKEENQRRMSLKMKWLTKKKRRSTIVRESKSSNKSMMNFLWPMMKQTMTGKTVLPVVVSMVNWTLRRCKTILTLVSLIQTSREKASWAQGTIKFVLRYHKLKTYQTLKSSQPLTARWTAVWVRSTMMNEDFLKS